MTYWAKPLALLLIVNACLCIQSAASPLRSDQKAETDAPQSKEKPVTGSVESFPGQQEKPSFDGNLALVQAMNKVALNDRPENRKELYAALLGSMLFVRVPEIPAGLNPGLQTTKSGMQIHLISTLDRNQVRVTASFTDLEALRNWDPNTPYLGIKAQDLFRLVMATDIQEIAINPFDPAGKMIRPGGRVTRHEIELLSEGVIPSHIGLANPRFQQFQMKANEKVFIGIPAHPPSSAVEGRLTNRANSLPSIAELYVFQMATQAGSSHTVIGIVLSKELAQDEKDEIVKSMGASVQPELKSDQSMDFMFLRGSIRDQVKALGTLIFRRP
jgi:hypothetical protein